jgi:hypothetical protein
MCRANGKPCSSDAQCCSKWCFTTGCGQRPKP